MVYFILLRGDGKDKKVSALNLLDIMGDGKGGFLVTVKTKTGTKQVAAYGVIQDKV